MPTKKQLEIIITRDFSFWFGELTTHSFIKDWPLVVGRGLQDQLIHFTGRTFRFIRYKNDFDKLGRYVCRLPLTHTIFTETSKQEYIEQINSLQKLIRKSRRQVNDLNQHLKEIFQLIYNMYPYYIFSFFFPSRWKKEFLSSHQSSKQAKFLIESFFQTRELSEGIIKLADNHLRRLLSVYLPVNIIKVLTRNELLKVARGKSINLEKASKRLSGFIYFQRKFYFTPWDKFLAKHNLVVINEEQIKNVGEIKGQVAYGRGSLKGKVMIIMNTEEVARFRQGMVLVTPMTSPEYLPAMKKAKAIITDEGGITSHAAIVARELKKPCIIGTKVSTKVLKDGDVVEVDTKNGNIKKVG